MVHVLFGFAGFVIGVVSTGGFVVILEVLTSKRRRRGADGRQADLRYCREAAYERDASGQWHLG